MFARAAAAVSPALAPRSYSKDLRQVLTAKAEKLNDEEADELVRECRPKADPSDDPGFERIYFEQFVAMLTDDTL